MRPPAGFAAGLAQIDGAHARVGGDLARRAFDQHAAADQHDDAAAKRNTRSMSCSMNRTVISRDRPAMAANNSLLSSLRHAGRRLVEQQHLRPRRQRQRDLEQALLAIGEFARRPMADRRQRQLRKNLIGLVDFVPCRP